MVWSAHITATMAVKGKHSEQYCISNTYQQYIQYSSEVVTGYSVCFYEINYGNKPTRVDRKETLRPLHQWLKILYPSVLKCCLHTKFIWVQKVQIPGHISLLSKLNLYWWSPQNLFRLYNHAVDSLVCTVSRGTLRTHFFFFFSLFPPFSSNKLVHQVFAALLTKVSAVCN